MAPIVPQVFDLISRVSEDPWIDFYMVKLANKMVSPFIFSFALTFFQTFLAIISIASQNFIFSNWIQ